ncbi:MAG TPA: transglutaminase domain-containing protein [Ferruginibacter sp.]|nr:transglutaminase domain-containing protein [Ferruginibacter sp.]
MKTVSLFIFLCFLILVARAQGNKSYEPVDNFVQSLGRLDSFNVATIADTLTSKFPEKINKARAIYYWIANNISIDTKATRSNDNSKSDPVIVIKTRKATSLGFATLVQEMSSMANIRCLVVDGYVKNFAEDINNKADGVNHSWNVIQLGQSPEQWYYVDAAKASGTFDIKYAVFTENFTSNYFFADKTLFNLDHYPDNGAWQLGNGPKNLKDFYALPVILPAAYTLGVQKPQPMNGFIKSKTKNTTTFSFNYNPDITISNISLVMGEGKKQQKPEPVNFSQGNGIISFTWKFKKDDTYPVTIVADGKPILQYYAEIEE